MYAEYNESNFAVTFERSEEAEYTWYLQQTQREVQVLKEVPQKKGAKTRSNARAKKQLHLSLPRLTR